MKFNLNKQGNSYFISFTTKGRRIRFFPGTDVELEARKILEQIKYEWHQGILDETLEKYKIKNKSKVQLQKIDRLLELFDLWIKDLQLSEATYENHYSALRKRIESANPKINSSQWFEKLKDNWSSYTYNSRKSFLMSCWEWGLNNKLVSGTNPYKLLKSKTKEHTDKVKPFNESEVCSIISAFELDYPYYSNYVKFAFLTGARPGEIIALTWGDINWESKRISIDKAYGKNLSKNKEKKGKILKSTKTGATGFIPLNSILEGVLLEQKIQIEGNNTNLVFPGLHGKVLDIQNFRLIWKKVLANLGIPYRYPYQCRHTALSKVATEQGLLAASQLARHKNSQMVVKHYAKFTGSLELPTY